MKWFLFVVFLLFFTLSSSQRTVEVERDDGSFSIGISSDSCGGTSDSVAALLSKASGWTGYTGIEQIQDNNVQVSNGPITDMQSTNRPYVEILKLIEALLNLKGEISGRFQTLINDNSHTIVAFRDTLVSKVSTLHNLTLSVLMILRRVLEHASGASTSASTSSAQSISKNLN